jgi:hypothetical protein
MRHLDGLLLGGGIMRRGLAPRPNLAAIHDLGPCRSTLACLLTSTRPSPPTRLFVGEESFMNLEAFRFERFSDAEGTRRRANTSGPANSQES